MKQPKKTNGFSILDRYFGFVARRSPFDTVVYHLVLAMVVITGLYLALTLNAQYIATVPGSGGTLVEGIIGTPRFVNPVLAITRADQDMVELIFSGLMKLDENGELVPDAAESVIRSEDGASYTVTLRDDVRFHNGELMTARDVAFTIGLIQNPDLKSPLQGNWDGVTVEVIDDRILTLTLRQPYTPFIENLTVGILPRTLWSDLPTEQIPFSQNNTEPIGSGPYQVSEVRRTPTGLISAYVLKAYRDGQDEPNISTLVFNFYQNEEQIIAALADKQISGTPALSTTNLSEVNTEQYRIVESPLPRTFGVYFNQNRSTALRDQAARTALSEALDRHALVDSILAGYGLPSTSPVPPGFLDVELESASTSPSAASTSLMVATETLENGGWTQTEDGTWSKTIDGEEVTLGFTLTTTNTDMFRQTAELLAETWRALGVQVSIEQFEQTDLVQAIIRPRDFEAVLYGADIGRGIDLYPFWHSSQKGDPGLNIAQYTNIEADGFLEDIRIATSTDVRNDAIRSFVRLVKVEVPAIFLFTPTFAYVIDRDVSMTDLSRISQQSERFTNIRNWHVQSNRIWPIFNITNNLNI